MLRTARSHGERWAAATVGATNAAGYQIASGEPIMAMGGFNGSDPTPTLAEFQQLVRDGTVRYYLAGRSGIPGGGGFGSAGGGNELSRITSWVQQSFRSVSVGGVTLYDFRSPASVSSTDSVNSSSSV